MCSNSRTMVVRCSVGQKVRDDERGNLVVHDTVTESGGRELRHCPAKLARGRVDRLSLSDESARAAVVSRFLKPS